MKKIDKEFLPTAVITVSILCVFLFGYHKFFVRPQTFPIGKIFTVNENESLKSISYRLHEDGYIDSPLLFRAGISFFGKDRVIRLGGYVFDKQLSLVGVIKVFVKGRPDTPLLSVTIPEGSTRSLIGELLVKAVPGFSLSAFNDIVAKRKVDGMLFPSTYYLLPSFKEEDIVTLMTNTFEKKFSALLTDRYDFNQFTYPIRGETDVLVLASILEGEANNENDMKIVAGILQERLKKEMLLQVDVAKETYTVKGLPKFPLNNPGLMAINAVLHPIVTPYFYYLTGKDGNMYYARTFEEHKRNIQKYLK